MSSVGRTYVIFDGDEDMYAYAFMKGWKTNERVEFDFADAHDLTSLTSRAADEAYVKSKLRERLERSQQVVVLVGDKTKNLFKFVRWEIEQALELNLPIIVVNLNGKRTMDPDRCPPILRGAYVAHVAFRRAIIKYALENFPGEHLRRGLGATGDRYYQDSVYTSLGLLV
jgi:hypothetical protein